MYVSVSQAYRAFDDVDYILDYFCNMKEKRSYKFSSYQHFEITKMLYTFWAKYRTSFKILTNSLGTFYGLEQ